MTTLSPAERDAICGAYVQATASVPDIIGDLHTLHYHGRDLHPERRQRIIADAVTAAQTLLVAVVAAERAMQPVPAPRKEAADA